MNKIILGTAQLGLDYGINNHNGKPSELNSIAILDEACLKGIERLDTADAYGDAIDLIGKYHKNHNKFKILNKFSFSDDNRDIVGKAEKVLEKLRISAFDVCSYHFFNDFIDDNKSEDKLIELKKRKLTNKIGISIYSNEEFEKVINSEIIDVIQVPYNILDNENKKGDLIIKAKQKGKEIHVRSVFLQGLFFIDENNIIPKLRPLVPYLKNIKNYCDFQNISINELSLGYVTTNPNIDGVLMGVDSAKQLKDNLSCMNSENVTSIKKFVETIDVKEVELLNPVNWK